MTISDTITRTTHRGDDATSAEAAADAATRRSTVRDRVLVILVERGAMTHDRLIRVYRQRALANGWLPSTASSIRTRCHELESAGRVERVPDRVGTSDTGRPAALWRAVIV